MDGLLVGRFQPFHLGHLHALKFALSKVENLWLGLGSSNKPVEKDNPFSAQERREMIWTSISSTMKERISIYLIPDLDDHVKWAKMIEKTVPKFQAMFSNDPLTVHIYSARGIRVIDIPFLNRHDLSGSNIRSLMAGNQRWEHLVPEATKNLLIQNSMGDRLRDIYQRES